MTITAQRRMRLRELMVGARFTDGQSMTVTPQLAADILAVLDAAETVTVPENNGGVVTADLETAVLAIADADDDTCSCGAGIHFDHHLGDWQHDELTECHEPWPAPETTS